MTHTIKKCRHGRTVRRCRCRGPHNVEIVPCVSAECLKEVEMKTDKAKIDLDEFEARMALIEAAEPAGNQRVHVQTWKLRAMIRAIRAAIAVEDETREMGECPFGEDASGALRPFRKDDVA